MTARRRISLAAALAALAAFAAWLGPTRALAAPVEVALVADLTGKVERRPTGADGWQGATLDAPLFIDDGVRTHVRSLAELRFVDGTLVAMDERTRLRISVTLFDVDRAPEAIRVALAEGHATVRAGRSRVNLVGADGAEQVLEPGEVGRVGAAPAIEPDTPPIGPDFELDGAPALLWSGVDLGVGVLDPLDPDLVLEPGFTLLDPLGPLDGATGARVTVEVRGR